MTSITLKRVLLRGATLAAIVLWVSTSGQSQNITYNKKVTSLAEVKSITTKLFAAFDDLIARNSRTLRADDKNVLYSTSFDGFYDTTHLPYTIGAVIKYFENELLIAKPEELIAQHKEFHAWRESALQLTDEALENVKKSLASLNRTPKNSHYAADSIKDTLVEIKEKLDEYKQKD